MFKLTGILGETYSDMGNYKVAIELFKKAAEECIEEFGESSSERIQALSALAAAHSHDGSLCCLILIRIHPQTSFSFVAIHLFRTPFS